MKTTQYLFLYALTSLLAVSFDSHSQATTTICGGEVPEGWVTISVNGNCGATSSEISRTIQDISGMSPGSTLTICGDPAPAGWVTMSVNSFCGFDGSYISRTIKKVEGYTAESQMTICDSPAPAGWVTTSINGNCGFNGTYLSRTIKRINDLPSGTVFSDPVCGDLAPEGWVTKAVTGNCGYNGAYIARTIKKIEGMAAGTEEEICGDLPPTGWITLTVNSNCGYNSSYIYRKIKKIDGLPSETELDICGDLPPANWVTLSISGNCGLNSAYIARKIKKVTCMPVGTYLTICGNDAVPSGWVVDSQNGNCGFNGTYNSRTIKKISGYPTTPTVAQPSTNNVCPGTGVNLSASNCPSGTITWSNNAVGASITVYPTTTTTYYAKCTQGECVSPNSQGVTVTVNSPDVQAPASASTCAGKTITLNASGCAGTYKWYDATTTFVSSNASYTTPVLNNSTTYYVSCTVNSCEGQRKSIPVTVSSAPGIPNSTGQSICAGSTATLTATGCGGTYKWYSSNTSTTILASTASYTTPTLNSNTTYYVSCTVSSCESSRKATTVTVTSPPSAPTASASGTAICNGQSVTLTATGCGGTVTWSTGQSGSSISVNTTGTYAAKCTVNGCVSPNSNVLTITSGNSGAPDNLTLSGTATAGIKAANKTITSTQVIPSGVNTTYNAGNNITLNPPFNANTGSIFKVEIKGCGG
jgi:AraC-like DNA-binding protein